MGVEIARDAGAVIGAQGGAFDPAFGRFREILCFGEKGSQVGRLEVKLVHPGGQRIPGSSRKFLNCRVIRRSLGASAAWTVFLDCPRGTSAGDDLRDILLNRFLMARL